MCVDRFGVAVPLAKRDRYVAVARYGAGAFRDHGAPRVAECPGKKVPARDVMSFASVFKPEEAKVACFFWIKYPDKEIRDRRHKFCECDPCGTNKGNAGMWTQGGAENRDTDGARAGGGGGTE